jgi:hypothetical protein
MILVSMGALITSTRLGQSADQGPTEQQMHGDDDADAHHVLAGVRCCWAKSTIAFELFGCLVGDRGL